MGEDSKGKGKAIKHGNALKCRALEVSNELLQGRKEGAATK